MSREPDSAAFPAEVPPAAGSGDPGTAGAPGAHPGGWRGWGGDLVGAFADLGTFLPLVVAVLVVQRMDPSGVLIGFGVFALATALVYRRPVPVQPMKVVAALAIAGGLDPTTIAATGMLLAIAVLALVALGIVDRLARAIPDNVLFGIQLGVGLYLAWAGIRLAWGAPLVGGTALAVLLSLQATRFKPLGAPLVLLGAVALGVSQSDGALSSLQFGLYLPHWGLPGPDAWWPAAREALLPQLALTLTNAILVTAAIAADRFPDDRARISANRLAWTTGLLNLVLAPFGAFPMCHGAGGLVVQHRFGARTGLAPALFGIACLGLGLSLGPQALVVLGLVPIAAVGALLLVAGTDLALTRRVRRVGADALIVIIPTGLVCVVFNVAIGLVAGLALEWSRRRIAAYRATA